ncbi:LLM class flavin-dependent oxidoreductase [Rhodococcus aetherivorans]|uniref:LLM class flavin-dependent oxidoreductase n=1 Tax=Rhodococcus aetherivorans TaxID=191292 RepID=UPI003698983E
MELGLRYDMRAPDFGAPIADLYSAALEQCAWADSLGFDAVHVAEHHGTEDGYLPSSLVFCSAVAARTKRIGLQPSALLVTLHDPLRLAEDLAVIDILSGGGRLNVVAGIGYLEREFEMFGVDFATRARTFETKIDVLRTALRGVPFEYAGRTVVVSPAPLGDGPTISIGGSAPPSARRAARLGLPYVPTSRELYELYEEELAKAGKPAPAPFRNHTPTFVHLAEDPERALAVVGPHVMHTSNMYARWAMSRSDAANGNYRPMTSLDQVRQDPDIWIITPEECLSRLEGFGEHDELRFHPLFGGLDPDESWESLRLFEDRVLPKLIANGSFTKT